MSAVGKHSEKKVQVADACLKGSTWFFISIVPRAARACRVRESALIDIYYGLFVSQHFEQMNRKKLALY
jgi:hypothetical protein